MYKLILIEMARRAIYIMIQEKDKFDLILSRWASGQSHPHVTTWRVDGALL